MPSEVNDCHSQFPLVQTNGNGEPRVQMPLKIAPCMVTSVDIAGDLLAKLPRFGNAIKCMRLSLQDIMFKP